MSDLAIDRRSGRRTLALAGVAHAMHDGMIDTILVLLPVFQAQFGLSYGVVGLLRALATGTMATAQIPAGRIADRFGGRAVLSAGTMLAGAGYLAAGLAGVLGGGFLGVCAGLFMIGLGASTQHPIASEFVAESQDPGGRRIALGIYNFTGDLGKMIVPPLAALLLVVTDWRIVCALVAFAAFAVGGILLAGLPAMRLHAPAPQTAGDDSAPRKTWPFACLVVIGILDSAGRMAFLTFLPFLLKAKGSSPETIGLALSLVFFGGACGKFVCAWLGGKIGPIATVIATEVMTAAAILIASSAALPAVLALLPLAGIAINGTSSILYGSVADLAPSGSRRRAFALFYTATIGAGAIAPIAAGLVIDAEGLAFMLAAAACIALAVIPFALALRSAFHAPLSGANTSPSP